MIELIATDDGFVEEVHGDGAQPVEHGHGERLGVVGEAAGAGHGQIGRQPERGRRPAQSAPLPPAIKATGGQHGRCQDAV